MRWKRGAWDGPGDSPRRPRPAQSPLFYITACALKCRRYSHRTIDIGAVMRMRNRDPVPYLPRDPVPYCPRDPGRVKSQDPDPG
jgi:hypothetical protein